eukprot:EG_transcript_28532
MPGLWWLLLLPGLLIGCGWATSPGSQRSADALWNETWQPAPTGVLGNRSQSPGVPAVLTDGNSTFPSWLRSSAGSWRSVPGCKRPPFALTCVRRQYAWVVPGQPFLYGDEACRQLERCGLTDLLFIGDSLLWHLFAGTALTLSRTLSDLPGFKHHRKAIACPPDVLFVSSGKGCRTIPSVTQCGGKVTLRHVIGPWPLPTPAQLQSSHAVVWGGGG